MLHLETTAVLKRLAETADEAYLVGGAVRDALLPGDPPNDLDVAVRGDGFALASSLKDACPREASFVPLDEARGTGRLVIGKPTIATLDISSFKGETILDDLRSRDFTINSMALKLSDLLHGSWDSILDPLGGESDMRARIIRACSEEAFRDDPVRILRAHRFQALLGFSISADTLNKMSEALDELPSASWERIRDELMAVLDASEAFPALREMDRGGVIDAVFPALSSTRGCRQNDYHHLDVWNHTMEMVRCLERLLASPAIFFEGLSDAVMQYADSKIASGRSRRALLKLAALFHDSGKPKRAREDQSGRIRFIGHEGVSQRLFESAARKLKLSNREIRTGAQWVKGHMRPMILTAETVTQRAIFRLHRHFGEEIVGLIILFLSDLAATRGPARLSLSDKSAVRNARRVLEYHFRAEESPPTRLLRGTDLISLFGMKPGPRIGLILRRIEALQGSGEVSTRDQAIEKVRDMLDEARER